MYNLDWTIQENPIVSPTVITSGGNVICHLFVPSARSLGTGNYDPLNPSKRTKSNTYCRGYKEVSRYLPGDATCWMRRRIVFTVKGLNLPGDYGGVYANRNVTGMGRLVTDLNPTTRQIIENLVFRGAPSADWGDVFTGKVDTNRVTLLSDRVIQLGTGNAQARNHILKQWYPCNKSLMYDDDEGGTSETVSYFASDRLGGMGDLLILDYYTAAATDTASMTVSHEGTYYWHER